MEFSITWRITVLISLGIGIIGVSKVSSEDNLIAWAISEAILGVILLICYYSIGVYIYRHKVPRLYFFFLVNAFLALSLGAFFDSLQAKSKRTFNYLIEGLVFMLVLTFFNWSTLERRRRNSAHP